MLVIGSYCLQQVSKKYLATYQTSPRTFQFEFEFHPVDEVPIPSEGARCRLCGCCSKLWGARPADYREDRDTSARCGWPQHSSRSAAASGKFRNAAALPAAGPNKPLGILGLPSVSAGHAVITSSTRFLRKDFMSYCIAKQFEQWSLFHRRKSGAVLHRQLLYFKLNLSGHDSRELWVQLVADKKRFEKLSYGSLLDELKKPSLASERHNGDLICRQLLQLKNNCIARSVSPIGWCGKLRAILIRFETYTERQDRHLSSPLVDDRPIMSNVNYKVVSGVVWTNGTMVSSNTDTNRTGVLAVVDIDLNVLIITILSKFINKPPVLAGGAALPKPCTRLFSVLWEKITFSEWINLARADWMFGEAAAGKTLGGWAGGGGAGRSRPQPLSGGPSSSPQTPITRRRPDEHSKPLAQPIRLSLSALHIPLSPATSGERLSGGDLATVRCVDLATARGDLTTAREKTPRGGDLHRCHVGDPLYVYTRQRFKRTASVCRRDLSPAVRVAKPKMRARRPSLVKHVERPSPPLAPRHTIGNSTEVQQRAPAAQASRMAALACAAFINMDLKKCSLYREQPIDRDVETNRQFNDLQAILYSLMYKFADVNCSSVVCCHSVRRRLGQPSPGGVKHRWRKNTQRADLKPGFQKSSFCREQPITGHCVSLPMRVKRSENGAAMECKDRGTGDIPGKPIRLCLGGRRAFCTLNFRRPDTWSEFAIHALVSLLSSRVFSGVAEATSERVPIAQLDFKHAYIRLSVSIGSQFVRHALDELEPITVLQGNFDRIPFYLVCDETGASANGQLAEALVHNGLRILYALLVSCLFAHPCEVATPLPDCMSYKAREVPSRKQAIRFLDGLLENGVQLSPSTVTADNQCAADIGIFVHRTVESSLQVIELENFTGLYARLSPVAPFCATFTGDRATIDARLDPKIPATWPLRVVSGVVWTNRGMVSSNIDTNRTGVLAVVDIGDSLLICLKFQCTAKIMSAKQTSIRSFFTGHQSKATADVTQNANENADPSVLITSKAVDNADSDIPIIGNTVKYTDTTVSTSTASASTTLESISECTEHVNKNSAHTPLGTPADLGDAKPAQPYLSSYPATEISGRPRNCHYSWYNNMGLVGVLSHQKRCILFVEIFLLQTQAHNILTTGYTYWKHAAEKAKGFSKNAMSDVHINATKMFLEQQKRELIGETIEKKLCADDIEKNRYYVTYIAEVIQFLVVNQLPFRGESGGVGVDPNGLFLELFEFSMRKDEKLQQTVTESSCVSMLANETRDRQGIEDLAIAHRYLVCNKPTERCIAVLELNSQNAQNKTSEILSTLNGLHFNFDKLIAQSYDGASVMKGINGGVQALISNELNGNIFYILFKKDRVAQIYEGNSSERLLVQRWTGHLDSVKIIHSDKESIVSTLELIGASTSAEQFGYLKTEAIGLLNQPVTSLLQQKKLDIVACLKLVDCLRNQLQDMRDDDVFHTTFEAAKKACNSTTVVAPPPKRLRKLPKQLSDCVVDNGVRVEGRSESELQIRSIYISVIDHCSQELENRFQEIHNCVVVAACKQLLEGATVAERLARSPLTKVIRVQSPPGHSGFLHVGIVPDDAVGRRVFSGISRFPRLFILALFHSHLNHPHRLSRPRCWHEERYTLPKSIQVQRVTVPLMFVCPFSDWLHETVDPGLGPCIEENLVIAITGYPN
ncbi:hypothetical protein PR048_025866 [Dryococelus australis]|uniref:Uncharacterized protein n=1 Tax=Dryococelus australis TaxID=614101 RepID=A0ABQ9GJS3_9NEOP|nr:hypothetical protein PR048_025866 [Dryococelus australis]